MSYFIMYISHVIFTIVSITSADIFITKSDKFKSVFKANFSNFQISIAKRCAPTQRLIVVIVRLVAIFRSQNWLSQNCIRCCNHRNDQVYLPVRQRDSLATKICLTCACTMRVLGTQGDSIGLLEMSWLIFVQ